MALRFCLPFFAFTWTLVVAGQEQWIRNRVPDYAHALRLSRLITETGERFLLQWSNGEPRLVESDSLNTRDEERGNMLDLLMNAAQERRRYLRVRWYNDSLENVASMNGLKAGTKRFIDHASLRLSFFDVSDQGSSRIREKVWEHGMEWLNAFPSYKEELEHASVQAALLDPRIDTIPLHVLVQDLEAAQLIDTALADRLRRRIKRTDDAVDVLAEAGIIRENPGKRVGRLKRARFVQRLVELGALRAVMADSVLHNTDLYEEWDDADLAAACERTFRLARPTSSSKSMEQYHLECFAGIRALFPGTFTGSLYTEADTMVYRDTLERPVVEDRYARLRFRFSAVGREYGGGCVRRVQVPEDQVWVESELGALISCVNKALCDLGDPERLLSMTNYGEVEGIGSQRIEVVFQAADRSTCEAWCSYRDRSLDTVGLLPYPFPNRWCADEIERVVEEFRRSGVLSKLSTASFDSALVRANGSLRYSLPDVLAFFPDVIISMQEPRNKVEMHECIDRLIKCSGGAFVPRRLKVRSRRSYYGLNVSFKQGGRKYSIERWGTNSVVTINKALRESGADGRFCAMRDHNGMCLLFLTKPQYNAFHERYLSNYFGLWE